MAFEVSEAIALAKDLLKTSSEFKSHNPDLAAQFAGRAYEICDDLGIDRSEIGEASIEASDLPLQDEEDPAPVTSMPHPVEASAAQIEEDAKQTSEQLSALLRQQARVLANARETEAEPPKPTKRSFWSFGLGRPARREIGALQTA